MTLLNQRNPSLAFIFAVFLQIVGTNSGWAQSSSAPVGEWRVLSSFSYMTDLTKDNEGNIWGSSTGGIFQFDPIAEDFIAIYTTENGLSRLDPSVLAYDSFRNRIIAGYPDGTLNMIEIETGQIIIRNDIKRTDLFTDKAIRKLLVTEEAIYVATGFGMVTFDPSIEFVRQSFVQFGSYPVGTAVNDIVLDIKTDMLWIATDQGIASGNLNEDLSLSGSWITEGLENFGGSAVRHIALFQDRIFAATASGNFMRTTNPDFAKVWSSETGFGNQILNDLVVDSDGSRLYAVFRFQLFYLDEQFRLRSFTLPGLGNMIFPDQTIWIGSYQNGLISLTKNGTASSIYSVNGPSVNSTFGIEFTENGLISGSSRFSDRNPLFDQLKGFSVVRDGVWSNFNMTNQPTLRAQNFTLVFQSLLGQSYAYFGSWGAGIARLDLEQEEIEVFNAQNTAIRGLNGSDYVVVSGLEKDTNGDIWAVSRYANQPLIYHQEGSDEWTPLAPSAALSSADRYMTLFIDSNDQKWITLESASEAGRGLMVLSTGQDPISTSDDRAVVFTTGSSSGNLPDATVTALVEDRNGEVWIGTERGIARFIFPDLILDGGSAERQAQWLIAEEPGEISPFLLRDVSVTAMTVNGANQKWIATNSDGLWLLNEEGSRVLAHYTAENSPLLSNTVDDLSYNEQSGELYITTSLGVIILTDVAVKGVEKMSTLSAYPNPFVYDRHERVVIEGLSERSTLFVVTVDGERVRRLETVGGRVEWDGLDLNGSKVASGVYLLIAIDENGGERGAGKLVVIR